MCALKKTLDKNNISAKLYIHPAKGNMINKARVIDKFG
jgi:hypothetical protein